MTEPLKKGTLDLLSKLDTLDAREDHVVDDLLARGARMDELLAGRRVLTVGELGALKDALAKLETTIKDVEAGIARAEAAAAPGAPGAAPSFAELTAEIHSTAPRPTGCAPCWRAPGRPWRGHRRRPGRRLADEAHRRAAAHLPAPTPPMKGTDVTSFQRVLNARFAAWGIHAHVAENGEFDAHTRQAARRALLGLGVLSDDYAHGITPALRSLIRTPSRRTPAQVERAKGQRPFLAKLRQHHAKGHGPSKHTARPTSKPSSKPGTKPGSHGPAVGSVAAAIRAHGGRYEDIVVREAKRSNVPASLICAVLQIETGFRNVFGHDNVRNPIKSPPRPAPDLEVTEDRYRSYLHHRHLGQGNQGVGPMQLTSPGLQDRADKLGGTWRPGPNIRVGVELLASNIKRLGLREGVRAYNGSGDAAERYATKVLELERVWRSRLQGHAANGHAVASGHASGSAPRTFKLTNPQMAGDDVPGLPEDAQRPVRRVGHPPPRR